LEVRPISTSRQPVLPLTRTSAPFFSISTQPVPSSVSPRPQSRPHDLAAPKRAGEAYEEDGTVSQAAEIMLECAEHRQEIVAEHGILGQGRAGMLATNASENFGDTRVCTIDDKSALSKTPSETGKTPLDRGDAHRSASCCTGRES
jgi:hypothetical protein